MDDMPDLSHLSEEERKIIEDVLMRQKAEEHKEQAIVQNADKELDEIERQINERRTQAMKLIGTQDDAICQICQKTKFSDGIGHKCHYCQLRSCLRCGGKTPIKAKSASDNRSGSTNQANKTQPQLQQQPLPQQRNGPPQVPGQGPPGQGPGPRGPHGPPQGMRQPAPQNQQRQPLVENRNGAPMGQQRMQTPAGGQIRPNQPNQMGPRPQKRMSGPQGPRPNGMPPQQNQQNGPRMGMNDMLPNQQQYPAPLSNTQGPFPPNQQGPPQGFQPNQQDFGPHPAQNNQPFPPLHNQPGSMPPNQSQFNPNQPCLPPTNQQQFQQPNLPPHQQQNIHPNQTGIPYNQPGMPPPNNQPGFPHQQVMPQDPNLYQTGPNIPQNNMTIDQKIPPEMPINQQGMLVNQSGIPVNQQGLSGSGFNNIPHQNGLNHRGTMGVNPPGVQGPSNQMPEQYGYNGPGPPHYDIPTGDGRPLPNGQMPNDRINNQPRISGPSGSSGSINFNGAPEFNARNSSIIGDSQSRSEDIYSSASTAKPPLPFRSEFEEDRRNALASGASNIYAPDKYSADARHQFGPVSDRDNRGEFPRDRSRDVNLKCAPEPPPLLPSDPKLKEGIALSQMNQFETGRFPLAPRGPQPKTKTDVHHHHNDSPDVKHRPKPILRHENKHNERLRKSRLTKQNRSMSSSDDELPSTSECPSCDDPEIESESFSEQDMLNKRGKAWREENALSNKIKKFLSHPVTWQPSTDGVMNIGHMVLHRHAAVPKGDLGFKVVGGRRTDTGRLAAFITRVRKGSVADTIGRLCIGDEVLEWNGRTLQNLSFEQVYDIISESKHEQQVEIIVSRPRRPMHENNQSINPQEMSISAVDLVTLPGSHHQVPMASSMPGLPNFVQTQIPIDMQMPMLAGYESAPMLMVSSPPINVIPESINTINMPNQICPYQQPASGQIFGKIQLSLYYSAMEAQLVVTVHQAVDLPPRIDGTPRNPYVKIFLLPDRSERSQRRTKALAGTCSPNWQEPVVYNGIVHADLMSRILEITVWDYDKYGTNEFLGEVIIDLSCAPLMNDTQWHMLTDMDDDNPLRARVQQRRLTEKLQSESAGYSPYAHGLLYMDPTREEMVPLDQYSSMGPHDIIPRSRTFHRSRMAGREEYYDQALNPSGYHSDHGYPRSPQQIRRRPRSTQGFRGPGPGFLRPLSPTEGLDPSTLERNGGPRALPPAPSYGYNRQKSNNNRYQSRNPNPRRHNGGPTGRALPFDPSSPSQDPRDPRGGGGYASDNSETSLSVTSTQSERPAQHQHMLRIGQMQPQHSLDGRTEDLQMYEEGLDAATMSDSAVIGRPGTGNLNKAAAVMGLDPKRKKSMITRLIPGRANSANNVNEQKRLGFARSEEIGVPDSLSPQSSFDLVKQTSKESTDSSESWLPVIADGPLGDFVSDLGPGQVVGRQVLASPCLGEIQIGISDKRRSLEVEIIRARNLVAKHGAKISPAPYVKVYLMEGKLCVAKAKTAATRRTTEPLFQARLEFSEPPQGRMLQITVWADYGRMERKGFMGIAQIQLDKLNLTQPVIGWYKLFHSNSLVAQGSSPSRKDSMPDMNTSPRSN